jgi:lipopolysaccharide biosynthesis regulator YciM
MDDSRDFRKKIEAVNQPKKKHTVQAARMELDRFLDEHPELRDFQEEIDRRLRNAGDSVNRLAVLGIMIEGKLRDLQDHMSYFLAPGKPKSG